LLIKNRNLFRVARLILLKLPGLFQLAAKLRTNQKRLLIIKTDAIGDYILFRNYIEIVKKSEKFKGYQIDFLGNTLWKDIALQYDRSYIRDFFFITPDDLYQAPLQTFKLGWRLFKNNYQTVLQPTFARTFITDGLAALTASKQIIGFEGDTERINLKYKIKTDRFYTQRLPLPEGTAFEFDRSRFFFENVLDQPISINSPHIATKKGPRRGIVIFPGAGVMKRSWEAEKFLALIKLVLQHTPQPVYLAGGAGELPIGDYLTENLPQQSVINLIGKTSLPQLIELIGNADLIIANETSAIHIAAATKTKAICILGGGHFKRFAPYPEYMENKSFCVFEEMECYYCNWNCKFQQKENEPYPCISNVSIEKVWLETLQLLSTV
jgi:ADP-heptose:LPS heptosyltransferase